MTMTLIATSTVTGATAATIDFTSIPSTYTDLYLVLSGRFNGSNSAVKITFNGVTTGYTRRLLYGTGSSVGSGSGSDGYIGETGYNLHTANTFGNLAIAIPNYAGNTNKSYCSDSVAENNATGAVSGIWAGLWSNTAAITSISLADLSATNSWVQYSTASLYGIQKGSGGASVSP